MQWLPTWMPGPQKTIRKLSADKALGLAPVFWDNVRDGQQMLAGDKTERSKTMNVDDAITRLCTTSKAKYDIDIIFVWK